MTVHGEPFHHIVFNMISSCIYGGCLRDPIQSHPRKWFIMVPMIQAGIFLQFPREPQNQKFPIYFQKLCITSQQLLSDWGHRRSGIEDEKASCHRHCHHCCMFTFHFLVFHLIFIGIFVIIIDHHHDDNLQRPT